MIDAATKGWNDDGMRNLLYPDEQPGWKIMAFMPNGVIRGMP